MADASQLPQDLFAKIVASIPDSKPLVWAYSDKGAPFMDSHGWARLVRERDELAGVLPSLNPYSDFMDPVLMLSMPVWLRNHIIQAAAGVEDIVRQACSMVDQSAFNAAIMVAGQDGYFNLSKESHGFERSGTTSYVLFGPRDFEVMSKPPHNKTFTGRPTLTSVVVWHELMSNSYSDFRSMACLRFPLSIDSFANDLGNLATKLSSGIIGKEKETFGPVQGYLSLYASALMQTKSD